MARNDDEEEEVAREKRRRARQERLKSRESEDGSGQPDGPHGTNSHSVTEAVSVSSSLGGGGGGGVDDEEEQVLMERMAKREERRQRRVKDAQDRQREQLEPDDATETNNNIHDADDRGGEDEERPSSWRHHCDDAEGEAETYGGRREEEEEEAPLPADEDEEQEQVGEEEAGRKGEEPEEEPPRRSYLREQEHAEDRVSPHVGDGDNSNRGESARWEAEGAATASAVVEAADMLVDSVSSRDKAGTPSGDEQEDNEVSENGLDVDRERKQNGGLHEETPPPKQHRQPERTFSRGSFRSPDPAAGFPPDASSSSEDHQDEDGGASARLEAELKLEELRRRRGDAESEEFERLRQRQQEAEVELDELKRRREGRRKVLEEEERQRKEEEAHRKAREEDEKRKMKEEIEKRRAEAAEKRQKVEELDGEGGGEGKPFKCVSPRGSSMKIGERAEFLNKSAQKSTVKASHSPVVSKIDNRLEQYTSAAQRENKESRSGATDLPMVTDGVRSIKSMWEKGNVFSSPGGAGTAYKEAAVMKIGVAGRINDWLNKTPEGGKTPAGGRPTDLKPVDVTNKRSLWENKGASPAKATGRGEAKSVTNGMGHY